MRYLDTHVAVISARRAAGVPAMLAHLDGTPHTWYVARGDAAAYTAAGAQRVIETGPLCASRNRALDDAHSAGLACLQLSDDLRRLHWYDGAGTKQPLSVRDAITAMAAGLAQVPRARLAGVSPTANTYFYRAPISTHLFVVGDMILVNPTPLRFDEQLLLKEDYDYTAQHLAAYGAVARVNGVMAEFRHRSNPGGAVAYRTGPLEAESIAHLRGKWGDWIRPNTRRPGEVLLKWKAPA